MRLFRSGKHDSRWFAFSPRIGWVMFPAEVGGWQNRKRARGIDPLDMREVPLRLGFNTGIPGADELASAASDMALSEVA